MTDCAQAQAKFPPLRYMLNGWRIESDIHSPFLAPDSGTGGVADIYIRATTVPGHDPNTPKVFASGPIALGRDGTGWIDLEGQGRILVPDGRQILVDVDPDLPPATLHTWLCGAAMSMLSHHRRQPPLHACVVEIAGRAVALSGHSGAGKSTTAAALLQRGHGLVTDDQAIIDTENMMVAPGYPSIKLWGSAANALDIGVDPKFGIGGGVDKYHVPLPGRLVSEPLPLGAIVMIEPDPTAPRPSIQSSSWPASLPVLHSLIHWRAFGRHIDGGKAGLAMIGRIARAVPLVILTRPHDFRALDALVDMVEAVVAWLPGTKR